MCTAHLPRNRRQTGTIFAFVGLTVTWSLQELKIVRITFTYATSACSEQVNSRVLLAASRPGAYRSETSGAVPTCTCKVCAEHRCLYRAQRRPVVQLFEGIQTCACSRNLPGECSHATHRQSTP